VSDFVTNFIKKEYRNLLRGALADRDLQHRVRATINAEMRGGSSYKAAVHAATPLYRDYFIKKVVEALEPWHWF